MKLLDNNGVITDEFKAFIENSNDLLFVKNKDFVYVAASHNFATNCVRVNGIEDIIGKTDFDLFEDRSIAAKYREDDEKILASGELWSEFNEEFPDKNGKKHLCFTTKYVLHDTEGNPVAVFGQYHNLGEKVEKEIARRIDVNRHIADALSKSFLAANYADLVNHTYITIRSMDYAKKMLDGCETIEQAFEAFITTLVQPEYQDKMRQFCISDTIAQRLEGKSQIDCEYLSNVAVGWCKASFLPCEWDADGNVTHALFAVSQIDETVVEEIEENITNRKNLKAIFDEIPGGIVLYEWSGKEFKILKMSQYYVDKYGYSMLNDTNTPDFTRIHPEDITNFRQAIIKALNETHKLDYVFRVWNNEEKRYGWTQINAVSEQQKDGTSLIYAIYTDVTRQKDAESMIAKKQASLEAALNTANQLCCEYDPVLHVIDSYTETNFFHIPTPLSNYPECVRERNFIHPDDVELFISTVHSTDDGRHSAHCDVRALRDGAYRWFSCRFEPYLDAEKGRNVIIITIIDATVRMISMQNYETQMNSMLSNKRDTLSMCSVNLTKNTFKMVGIKDYMEDFVDETASYEDVMLGITDSMLRDSDKEAYRALFNRKHLLQMAEEGNMHAEMEYLLKMDEHHYEWIKAYVDMVNNPLSGEVTGIAYSRSSQKKYMEKALLSKALSGDYIFAAVVFVDTDEFYIYNARIHGFGERREHFWDVAFPFENLKCSQETIEHMKEFYTKDKMLKYLENNPEFTYFFDSSYSGENTRLRAKFRYLDDDHTSLLVSLRNFTDEEMQEQWKYDSEHDALTGLYNRKKVFKECRRLIDEHPDNGFVMIHCDVEHFHLYNTFFGEKAGDKLLRRMAEVIRHFEKDYCCYTCGRLDSDAFCIFIPDDRDTLEKHINMCAHELESFSPNFPISLSIGTYWVTDASMSIEEMYSRATIAAKSGRKNLFGQISKYDEVMERETNDSQEVIASMNAAIADEQFKVYLQPKYSLRTEKIVGSEALVRWFHPERGMISPGKFIPVFEKNGFIAELDMYMWEHVCQIIRRWIDEGQPVYPVSVNISRVSMYSHATVPFLKSLVEKYAFDPKYLELELTETAYMDDPEDLKRMLKELQDYGFKILMDDFGSGYSALNTLRELPVDILKLDMKFLSTSKEDTRGLAVLSSVVRMSKLLKLPIVAEGVEQREQADFLRSIGCEYVQGYLFGRPMPVEDYEKLLKEGNHGTAEEEHDEALYDSMSDELSNAEVVIDDPLISIGLLEYNKDRFAYLRTNRQFLKEFGLLENLKPASEVFRAHLDDTNYSLFMRVLDDCARTHDSILFNLEWTSDNGKKYIYNVYAHYHGNIGNYENMTLTFVNVTGIRIVT